MSPIKKKRRYYYVKASQPLRELPQIELIPVFESRSEFERRIQEVREILAQMFVNSTKRGRPSRSEEQEESYAA